ncbi:MAG: glycosyltransferase, partial [Candidatus Angelobacter sp.]
MLIAAAAIVLLIWIYLLVGHGRFWRISRFIPEPALSEIARNTVAVVLPARNEAEVIGRAVASLLQSQGLRRLQIFLVDDGSSDGTAEAALQA